MSTTAVTLTVDESRKRLSASAPLAARESVPVTVSPAAPAAGTCVLLITRFGSPLASAVLTDGAGTLDLSTDAVLALFAGQPSDRAVTVDADLWNDTDKRLLGKGRVTLHNTPASADSLRVAAAGELAMTLAAALPAGAPVMRDDAGQAAACRAANAKRLLGVLRTGGETGAAGRVVTAGAATVAGWGLTPGAWYYLSASSDALTPTAPEGYNVRPVGIALDADTLVLIPGTTVQQAAGAVHYLTWDGLNQRLLAAAPAAASAGAASAGAIPCLDAAGKLDISMIPPAATANALAALRAQFAALEALESPSLDQIISQLNAVTAILKTGAP